MTISVNTNKPALIALQALNRNSEQLAATQNRVNTGLKIGEARDNASVYAVAQGQRSNIDALGAVKISLDRATSIADVAMTGGQAISDLLNDLKEKALAATSTSLDTVARTALNTDFQSTVRQLAKMADTASFDGSNMLNGSITGGIEFIADSEATSTIELSAQDLSLGGGTVTLSAGSSVLTAAGAETVLDQIEDSLKGVNSALANLGAQSRQIEAHKGSISKLTDVLESGVGNLVDADLAKESARLEALQVMQQLGAQSLSTANSAPQIVLSLFQS